MDKQKVYEAKNVENKWYSYWLSKRYFHSTPDDREPYTVVIPPPNVTGVLHMGHMLNNTIQDVLVRRARMLGKNACWVPGTDHASIATEAKVVQKLRAEGIKKGDLSRKEFLAHAFEWKDKHGGIILEQLKKLGCSCDWDRTHFTMDEEYSKSVIKVFIDFYNKGKIYRNYRMVNWDTEAKTALSDEEVIYKEVNSKLFYLKYKIIDADNEWLTIATTRPETILGDTAICVHPDDDRYIKFHNKKVIVPICNRVIPIICDEYVDKEFGTGCLKVTPAHDVNDYELGKKHKLESIDILNDNGTLNNNGLHYNGIDRFEVRKLIEQELNEKGFLIKVEEHLNKIGFSERTNAVIEPKLSLQWFLDMKELSKPALDNVLNGNIKFYPEKFKNTYRYWMENIKDWCISRQLWWGHQIPAWYYGENINDFVVASSSEEALKLIFDKTGKNLTVNDIKQDEDVLDTWFSSWLWPISVFNGLTKPNNEEIKYYYPTNDLVTAPEIMFFWVARMIIAGYEYMNELPFRNVYYTGIVRDKLGRKMSKSLGNSPDPLELIENYGADGVRMGILLSSPAGNDLPFDSSQCEQGRNFSNKMWNAYRLCSMWKVEDFEQSESNKNAVLWFESKFNEQLFEINALFDKFKISEALMSIYKLFWDDFCSWYLECVKPGFEQAIDKITYEKTIVFFENCLKLIHPFMPFITEELWHLLKKRNENDDIIISKWPLVCDIDNQFIKDFNIFKDIVSQIRNIRKEQQLANKTGIGLYVLSEKNKLSYLDSLLIKLTNLTSINYTSEKNSRSNSFITGNIEYFVPLSENINIEEERKKLESELQYFEGFLVSVQKKLSNQKFVSSAPSNIVEIERKKESDTLTKIKLISDKILMLKNETIK